MKLQKCWQTVLLSRPVSVTSRGVADEPRGHTLVTSHVLRSRVWNAGALGSGLLTRLPPRRLPRPGSPPRSAGAESAPKRLHNGSQDSAAQAGGPWPATCVPQSLSARASTGVGKEGEGLGLLRLPLGTDMQRFLCQKQVHGHGERSWGRREGSPGGVAGSLPEPPPHTAPCSLSPPVPSRARTLLQTSAAALGGRAVWQIRTKLQHGTA